MKIKNGEMCGIKVVVDRNGINKVSKMIYRVK